MTESSGGEPHTLAGRLEDETRSVDEADLQAVTDFLYETLGRWYELQTGDDPPSVEPPDIIIRTRTLAPQVTAKKRLFDPGDELHAPETGDTADERDGVFAASTALAQTAMGRLRTDDESWDDVIRQLEIHGRPALASALWVGLATEPEARYRSIGQWRRSVDAAMRSDAATATFTNEDGRRSRTGPIVVAAGILSLAVATGAFLFLRNGPSTVEEARVDTTEPEGPTTEEAGGTTSTGSTSTVADSTGTDSDRSAAGGDPCAMVGPVGPITIDQVSDTAIVVAWPPSNEAVNIALDGAFVDTVPPGAFRYVIEHLPLSESPLTPDTEYTVAVEPRSGEPSTACTTTSSNPIPSGEFLIGVTSPTGLEVIDTSPTSITVGWDLRPGADLHNLYLDGTYVQFGDVGGSSAVGDETEFTFVDLEPDTTYEIGIRRIEGPNQSGLATIVASTDSG